MSNVEAVRRIAEKVAQDHDYTNYNCDIKQITTGGANFTSFLYEIRISEENRDALLLFAKVGAFGEEMRKSCPIEEVYYLEMFFYQTIAKVFQSLEEQNKVPEQHRLILSNVYAYKRDRLEETLVMDDLSKKGFQSYDRFQVLDWEQMKKVLEELTKFHALSFAYGHKYPEKYTEAITHMRTVWKDIAYPMWTANFKASRDVLEGKNREVFDRFMQERMDECYEMLMKGSSRAVFIHGDFRPSNLMHKANEGGDVVILDYQTLRSGSVITDLIYLIYTSTDQSFRKQHYDELLEFYFSHLQQALQRLGVDPNLVYSKQDFEQELKDLAPLGLAVAAFTLPVLLADKSELPELNKDLTLDRFNMQSNYLSKQRISEVVEEYIQWGIVK